MSCSRVAFSLFKHLMERSKALSKLEFIFRDMFDDQNLSLSDQTSASDIDDWDSLMQIRLLIEIEREFKVSLNPLRIADLQNIGDMLDYLMEIL